MERTVISISRQYGSGGRKIGEAAAGKRCSSEYGIEGAARSIAAAEEAKQYE